MRLVFFLLVTIGTGLAFAAIARAVIPTSGEIRHTPLLVLGLAAGAVGVAVLFASALFGPIAAAGTAVLLVVLYDRLARA
jgi:hypothetical protein